MRFFDDGAREATESLVARETGCAHNWVHHGYGEELHLHLGLSLTPSWVAGTDTFENFLLEQGFLEGDFDVRDWIDPSPLREVTERLGQYDPAVVFTGSRWDTPAAPGLFH